MDPIVTFLAYATLTLVSMGVVWKGSEMLESSSEKLSVYYRLPPLVQGSIVTAVGSSFPELSTAVLATLIHGEFELGVAAIVGSALFNVLMIPALAGLWSEEELVSTRDLIYKEMQFYLISIAVLLLVFSFAVIYYPVARPDIAPVLGQVTRYLALFPLGMYLLYVYLQYQDTIQYRDDTKDDDVDPRVFEISPSREGLVLLGSLVIILAGVEGLVQSAIVFGEIFNTPSFLWGMTIVAAATSIPDAFVSIQAARSGNPIASVANVLGSNIFDLLVCIPAGVLIAGTVVINYSVAVPMMGMLTIATLVVLLMMRNQMMLSKQDAWVLIAFYFFFVIWMSIETFGAVDLIPNLPPPSSGAGA